jgi:hypothetical protein
MTKDEIQAAWTRYMHRSDLSADLEQVWVFAGQMIENRLMQTTVDLDAIAASSPQLYLHAGLTYLHELAMDDEGLAREENRFASALSDYAMRWSLTHSDAQSILYGGRLAP